MISTRNVLNQQAQAIGGKARRYEQPVSSFTRPAMRTVASLSRPQQTTPTQATPTRQPIGAPPTLSAMAAGIIGGGVPQAHEAPTPQGAFEEAVSRDMAIGMAVPSLVRGALNSLMAMSMSAPMNVVDDVALKGIVGTPKTALSAIANLAMGGKISADVADAFGDPQMDTDTFNDISAMAGTLSLDDPTEAFSPEDMAAWDTTRQALIAKDNLTSNPLKSIGYLLGLIDMPSKKQTSLVGSNATSRLNAAIDEALAEEMDPVINAPVDKALEDTGIFAEERGLRSKGAIADAMNREFGDFTEAGAPLGGQVGDLDPSFSMTLGEAFDAMFGDVFGMGGDSRSGTTGGFGPTGEATGAEAGHVANAGLGYGFDDDSVGGGRGANTGPGGVGGSPW